MSFLPSGHPKLLLAWRIREDVRFGGHYVSSMCIYWFLERVIVLLIIPLLFSLQLTWTNCRINSQWFETAWHSRDFILMHYNDVRMSASASPITSLMILYSTVYSDADRRKHQSSASLAFVGGIHRSPVNSQHKGPVTRKMFPFDDVIIVFDCVSGTGRWQRAAIATSARKASYMEPR